MESGARVGACGQGLMSRSLRGGTYGLAGGGAIHGAGSRGSWGLARGRCRMLWSRWGL